MGVGLRSPGPWPVPTQAHPPSGGHGLRTWQAPRQESWALRCSGEMTGTPLPAAMARAVPPGSGRTPWIRWLGAIFPGSTIDFQASGANSVKWENIPLSVSG